MAYTWVKQAIAALGIFVVQPHAGFGHGANRDIADADSCTELVATALDDVTIETAKASCRHSSTRRRCRPPWRYPEDPAFAEAVDSGLTQGFRRCTCIRTQACRSGWSLCIE